MGKGSYASRVKEWMTEYAYLVTLAAVIAVIAASAIYTQKIRRDEESGMQAAAQAPELAVSPSPTAPEVTPLPSIAPLEVRYFGLDGRRGTVWPVSGGIIRPYDEALAVYWEALACVQVHAALDIAGEAGERVLCVSDGVVSGVSRDELWGWRVRIHQTDGREAVYAGLLSADVREGQSVARGHPLGMLMETIPCEEELGAHLHMELYRDGSAQDPEGIMPDRREKPVAVDEI